jgi:hypothetical protein
LEGGKGFEQGGKGVTELCCDFDGHQHGVGALLYVVVLNEAIGTFVQQLQHLV